ncbi:c-type cytochrome [Neoroseomonas soli]|uniref:C-type cytochrome n=1 Tax=Neoroseomonas soli TaxID=1081025 RepID=A0A9X9X271_9PROT|nr:c-type cytochrome [Neoroseomonas soli]MBR0673500.1 c-type cytochrome [Neoroseomonas soli]
MARCHPGAGIWGFAAVLVVLLCGPRDLRAQGSVEGPSVPVAAGPCFSCHGPFGRPETIDYPIIGGQSAAYLASALRAYRAGQRSGELAELMAPFAQPLDDRAIEDLAAFFSSLRSLR